MKQLKEYLKKAIVMYGKKPTEYQRGVLQGMECSISLTHKSESHGAFIEDGVLYIVDKESGDCATFEDAEDGALNIDQKTLNKIAKAFKH